MINSLLLVLVLALSEIACTGWQPMKPQAPAHLDKKPYPCQQGVVASLPSEKDPRIAVWHAAIPKIGPQGEKEPTDPALMPFWLAPSTNITGLKEGARIQFDVETDWDTETPVSITSIKKLDERSRLSCP